MSEGYSRSERYVVDGEMADALKMELSSVSPEMKDLVNEISENLSQFIIERYGSHISDNTKERIDDLPNRVVVIGEEDFTNFKNAWHHIVKEEIDHSIAIQTSLGDLIILSDQQSLIRGAVKDAKKMNPSLKEEDIRTTITIMLFTSSLVHEILHAYQDPDTTRSETAYRSFFSREALDECGVAFITNEIMSSALPQFTDCGDTEIARKRASFFENIKNKYGDVVYDVLFGKEPEEGKEEYLKLERDIISEFTPRDLVKLNMLDEKTVATLEFLIAEDADSIW